MRFIRRFAALAVALAGCTADAASDAPEGSRGPPIADQADSLAPPRSSAAPEAEAAPRAASLDVWDHVLLDAPFQLVPLGETHVVVGGRQQLLILGRDGSGAIPVGRFGEGPGEFQRVNGVAAGEAGEFFLFDSRLSRLSWFSSDGEFIDSRQIAPPRQLGFGSFVGGGFLVDDAGVFHAQWDQGVASTVDRTPNALLRIDSEAAAPEVAYEWEGRIWVELPDGALIERSPADGRRAVTWSHQLRVAAVAADRSPCVTLIDVEGPDPSRREVCVPWDPVSMSRVVPSDDEMDAAGLTDVLREMLAAKAEVQDFGGTMDAIQSLEFDDEGCLWARMTNDEASYDLTVMATVPTRRPAEFEWRVIDPTESSVVATVRLRSDFDPEFRRGDTWFGFLTRPDDTEWIATLTMPELAEVSCR